MYCTVRLILSQIWYYHIFFSPLKFFITSFLELLGLLFVRGDVRVVKPLLGGLRAEKFARFGVASPIFWPPHELSDSEQSAFVRFLSEWWWLFSDGLRFLEVRSELVLRADFCSALVRGMHIPVNGHRMTFYLTKINNDDNKTRKSFATGSNMAAYCR